MIILKNATYIDWQSLEFSKTSILVNKGIDNNISFISNSEIENYKNVETIDCSGKLVTKSFGVGHHHVYSSLSRGMGAPKKNPQNFQEILKYVWWTLDKCLDQEMIEYSALTTAIACAKAGSTFAIDHHASPFAVEGSLEIIANAFEKIGVSHLLCYEISDRDGMNITNKGLKETESYLKNKQALVGLHASFTVGNNTLENAVTLMNNYNSGIHIHVAEDLSDQAHCLKTYGKRVINRLHKFGVLNSSKTILGHCIHLDHCEIELIKNSNSWVVQNMESNLNNKVGHFSGTGLGNNIMLGTDGMHSDMLQSAKFAFFAAQINDKINYDSTYKRFRNIHHYLKLNNFKGDGDNNLVVLDYASPTPLNMDNFYGHFLFGFNSAIITDVISDGKLIVKNRIIQTVDENQVVRKAQEIATKLWKKMAQ
ncbi:MAG: amidohydrolase family protein [Bacteroidales bacterium]|nr:amidohydrolase family protein [Bacteroidales bacterium]MDY0141743.1 amidohydrolase family protein [Bacteroidales bacterium]